MASNETAEDRAERLQREKLILKEALANPGVQFFFSKLHDAADKLPLQMMATSDNRHRDWLQACYRAYRLEPERIFEVVMNCDFEALKQRYPDRERWSFKRWLHDLICRIPAEREE